MPRLVPIDDPGDERLADYLRLTDAELRRRDNCFLCEGVLVVRRALELGVELRSVLVTPERLAALGPLPSDLTTYLVDRSVMAEVTGFNLHRGVIAAATRPAPRHPDEVLAGATTVAVLQGLNDSENLGAVFRNAAAFGVDAVLLDPRTADPLYRRVVRVSMGHVLAVPHARIDDLGPLEGFEVVALTPAPDAEPITALQRTGRVALLLGAEGPGLTDDWLQGADRRIRIPLAPGVDSLNVATAAAVAFHHRFG
jgi:tRNA G18 (ribose-2'-O)-methylase SpoU